MLDPAKLKIKQASGDLSDRDIHDMIAEIQHYQTLAAYLASCHAATLECLPKRTAIYARKRLTDLCDIAANMLEQKLAPNSRITIVDAVTRCRKAKDENKQ